MDRLMFDLDAALRYLVEAGGSDLHLRSGSIPLIRKDGVLVRLDEPAQADARIDLLLRSIGMEPSCAMQVARG